MATETLIREQVLRPEPEEQNALVELEVQLGQMIERGDRTAKLISPHGDEVELPASAFNALKIVADGMARGLTMMLVPQGKELTTQQAADILHVSRPHLVKLLERGEMPYHHVGSHRRIKIEDVLQFRAQRNQRRRQQLDELAQLSEEIPGGYE